MEIKKTKRMTFSEREEIILKNAITLFSLHGFVGTTTKALAKQCRINEALIFRHYKNKEELYTALLKNQLQTKGKTLEELDLKLKAEQNKSLNNQLMLIGQFLINQNKEDPNLIRMMIFASLENHKLGQVFFKQRMPLLEFMEDFFSKNPESKNSFLTPGEMARTYLSMVYHQIFVTQVFGATHFYKKSDKAVLADFVKVFLKGIL